VDVALLWNLSIGNKEEKVKYLMDEGNMLLPFPPPFLGRPSHVKSLAFLILYGLTSNQRALNVPPPVTLNNYCACGVLACLLRVLWNVNEGSPRYPGAHKHFLCTLTLYKVKTDY